MNPPQPQRSSLSISSPAVAGAYTGPAAAAAALRGASLAFQKTTTPKPIVKPKPSFNTFSLNHGDDDDDASTTTRPPAAITTTGSTSGIVTNVQHSDNTTTATTTTTTTKQNGVRGNNGALQAATEAAAKCQGRTKSPTKTQNAILDLKSTAATTSAGGGLVDLSQSLGSTAPEPNLLAAPSNLPTPQKPLRPTSALIAANLAASRSASPSRAKTPLAPLAVNNNRTGPRSEQEPPAMPDTSPIPPTMSLIRMFERDPEGAETPKPPPPKPNPIQPREVETPTPRRKSSPEKKRPPTSIDTTNTPTVTKQAELDIVSPSPRRLMPRPFLQQQQQPSFNIPNNMPQPKSTLVKQPASNISKSNQQTSPLPHAAPLESIRYRNKQHTIPKVQQKPSKKPSVPPPLKSTPTAPPPIKPRPRLNSIKSYEGSDYGSPTADAFRLTRPLTASSEDTFVSAMSVQSPHASPSLYRSPSPTRHYNSHATAEPTTRAVTATTPQRNVPPLKSAMLPPPPPPPPPLQPKRPQYPGHTSSPATAASPYFPNGIGGSSSSASLPLNSLANAIVASSLASARLTPSNTGTSVGGASQMDPLRRQKSSHLLQTLRREGPVSDGEEEERIRWGRFKGTRKRHAHHEGARRRWRDTVSERECKRYDAVWASNRGHLLTAGVSEDCVVNIVARDIWARSRLPADELAEVWDLVDRQGKGMLTRPEFVVGMWLIDQRLRGRKIPAKVSESVWASVVGMRAKR